MKHQQANAKDILSKYVIGQCTEEEKLWVEKWYKDKLDESFLIDNEIEEQHLDEVWLSLKSDLKRDKIIPLRRIAAIAASLTLIVGLAFYFSGGQSYINQEIGFNKEIRMPAGRNQALLTLTNGKKVYLDSISIGSTVSESGIIITKMDDGTLTYRVNPDYKTKGKEGYNTISTPRGGQYKVILPDNSKVWLNAVSSIKFPISFSGKTRLVELEGEGYFEVAHNKEKPFIVSSFNQQTIVKGTKFNITSYSDEDKMTTTLIEGAVVVKTENTVVNETFLKPNEQLIVNENFVTKIKVDATEAIAWKDGKFVFNNTPLKVIMHQLSRWYDVDVEYLDNIEKITFTGSISRFDDMQDVLRKISLTESVKFETRGRRVMIKH